MLKKQNGITLVALVIIITVLLILASITINIKVGEKGIIKSAQDIASSGDKEKVKEEIGLAWLALEREALESTDMSRKDIFTQENLSKNISGNGLVEELNYKETGDSNLRYKKDGIEYNITVSAEGEVSIK